MNWSVLALLFVFAFGSQAQNVSEQYLLVAANQDRALGGLGPLRVDPELSAAAAQHAREMARRGAISHQFAGEAGLVERVGQAGAQFSLVTENVAEASDAALIHDLWMHSPGHRRNLLDADVTAVGIAVVRGQGQLYAVEDFARMVKNVSLDGQEQRVEQSIVATGVPVRSFHGDARQTCTLASGYAGVQRPWFVMRYTSIDLAVLPSELTVRLASGRYREAEVGACSSGKKSGFSSYTIAVMLFP